MSTVKWPVKRERTRVPHRVTTNKPFLYITYNTNIIYDTGIFIHALRRRSGIVRSVKREFFFTFLIIQYLIRTHRQTCFSSYTAAVVSEIIIFYLSLLLLLLIIFYEIHEFFVYTYKYMGCGYHLNRYTCTRRYDVRT